MTNTTDVTVSIVNWNTKSELRDCVTSVLSQTGDISFEVNVVDNASSDGSVEMIRSEFAEQVKLIANDQNLGFGTAHNQSIGYSSGRYVLLLNPDCRLIETDTLVKLTAYMNENPAVGVVGPRIVYPDGSLQYSARRNPTALAAIFRHTFLGKLFPNNRFVRDYLMTDWAHDQVTDVDWLSGAALMLRREMLDRIGLLDERFFMYCEDVDICRRARDAGWRVVYYPMTTITHRIGAASDLNPIPMIKQHHKSMFRYFLKYNRRSAKILLAPLIWVGLLLRQRSLVKKAKCHD